MNWREQPPWVPLEAPLRGTPVAREPTAYAEVVDQFAVLANPRYSAKTVLSHRDTYCNIFVWDCTRALGCEIPHWYDPATGEPTPMGEGKEQPVEVMAAWLDAFGGKNGWLKLSEPVARVRAGGGHPVIALYRAPPGQVGHVAMVLPNGNIAQAGSVSLWGAPIEVGFGKLHVEFWGHE